MHEIFYIVGVITVVIGLLKLLEKIIGIPWDAYDQEAERKPFSRKLLASLKEPPSRSAGKREASRSSAGIVSPKGFLDIDPAYLAKQLAVVPKECWRIMPFWRPGGGEWWIIEPDKLPNVTEILPTKEEAFNIALAHNKESGVNAVWVYGACMKGGGWERQNGVSP